MIKTLNARLKAVLGRVRGENADLEKKRAHTEETSNRAKRDASSTEWRFKETREELVNSKVKLAMMDTDEFVQELNTKDKSQLVDALNESKDNFTKALKSKIARKRRRLASVEAQLVELAKSKEQTDALNQALVLELRDAVDGLKAKKKEMIQLEDSISEKQHQLKIQATMEKQWTEKCAIYEGHDAPDFTANKEALLIKEGETELEARFAKIYNDSVAHMTEQAKAAQELEQEKQRQSAAERQQLEAEIKELKKKSKGVQKEIVKLQNETTQISKDMQADQAQLDEISKEVPVFEQDKEEQKKIELALKEELKGLADVSDQRLKEIEELKQQLKEKLEQSVKAKEAEDMEINTLRAKLTFMRNQLDDSNIGLLPEISKYRGLVDVVEVKLTPEPRKKRRITMA